MARYLASSVSAASQEADAFAVKDLVSKLAYNGTQDVTDYFFTLLYAMLMCAGAALLALVGFTVACAAVFTRAVELYVLFAFSPVPTSLLAFDETRQMGVGFYRNFAAVALGAAVMALVLYMAPSVLTSGFQGLAHLVTSDPDTGVTVGADGLLTVLESFAAMGALTYAIAQSGSMARAVLGG